MIRDMDSDQIPDETQQCTNLHFNLLHTLLKYRSSETSLHINL